MSDSGTPEITIVNRLLIEGSLPTTKNVFLSKARKVYKTSLCIAEKVSMDTHR